MDNTTFKNSNASACRKCLQHSLPVDIMIRFAQIVYPEYNIYKRPGLSEGITISNQTAAQFIISDLVRDGYYIDFVEALLKIDAEGHMGRRYALRGLSDVVAGVIKEGYSFDKVTGQFFEDQNVRISPNWGRLQDGDERRMAVLRLDIAGNSILVKENPGEKVNKAYHEMRAIVNKAVTSRIGRLWSWEGDGALAAFMFGSIEKMAVYCGMEILHEMFFFNKLKNPLKSPIKVRIAVHIGPILYSSNVMERLKNDTIKEAVTLESRAASPDSMAASYNLFMSMDPHTMDLFTPELFTGGIKYRLYKTGMEKA
jgi:class 3 adenylate cyclase